MSATSRTSYIRFVGGPWHNRVECVELIERVAIRKFVQGQDTGGRAIYSLVEYKTSHETHYWQYVHSSLIRGDQVACCTYSEKFGKFRLGRQDLERLRRVCRWKANVNR